MQVVLYNYFLSLEIQAHCENEKNIFKVFTDRMEILVELSGELMEHLFIDVLVKSSKSFTETLQFIDLHVLKKIEDLCKAPQGCQGVSLVKAILRPKVVQELFLCKNRKDQAILVEALKQELLGSNLDLSYVHSWPKLVVPEENPSFLPPSMDDSAMSLLGEEDTQEVIKRRQHDLLELDVHFNNLQSNETTIEVGKFESPQIDIATTSYPSVDSNLHMEIRSFRHMVVQRFDNVDEKLQMVSERVKSLKKLIERIHSMEDKLYDKLAMKLDGITNLSLQLRQRQVPCNAYFTTIGAKQQRRLIVTKMLTGIETLHLHLLCEDLHEIHVVKDQKGVQVRKVPENVQKIVPFIVAGLTIFSLLLKVGAHVVAGIGDMVPNIGNIVALAFDTQSLNDYLPNFKMGKNITSQGNPSEGQRSTLPCTVEDALLVASSKDTAEQWLVNFLKDKDIFHLFGLYRVQYRSVRNESEGLPIRWVCEKHRLKGINNGTIRDCPFN